MSELHKALADITNIRQQVARSTEFRGYGPATLAATSVMAIAAAQLQSLLVPAPAQHNTGFLAVWVTTAVLAAALTIVQMVTRTRRIHSGLSNEMLGMAVEQFLPALGAGLLLMLVLVRYAPAALWMLPGLWQIVFALGIFSSCRFLPKPMHAAAAWYLLTGLTCLAFGQFRPLSPWLMGVPFGAGQLLIAAILFFSSQREPHEE